MAASRQQELGPGSRTRESKKSVTRYKNGEKCEVCVFRCYGTQSRTASNRRTVNSKSSLPEQALLFFSPIASQPRSFSYSPKMARNAKCAFSVAMALGRAQQAAGKTLTSKSGLPELAPMLAA